MHESFMKSRSRGKLAPNLESESLNQWSVAAGSGGVYGRTFFKTLIVTVGTLSIMAGVTGCGGSVPAPTGFVAYHSPDGRFSCDYPKGWQAEGGGKADKPISWAKFTSGNAEIRVDADFAGSLFGDIAKSGNALSGSDEAPAAKVHPLGIRHMKDEFSNYTEREATSFQSKGLGEGRKSIFIASGSLGGKTFGYRATLLSGERRITIITSCPAANWQVLKPAFDKVILSLRQGGS